LPTNGGLQRVKLLNLENVLNIVDGLKESDFKNKAKEAFQWLTIAKPTFPIVRSVTSTHSTSINHSELEKDVELAERISGLITPEMSDSQRRVLQNTVVALIAKESVQKRK